MHGYLSRKVWRQNNWRIVLNRLELPENIGQSGVVTVFGSVSRKRPLFLITTADKNTLFSSSTSNVIPIYACSASCPTIINREIQSYKQNQGYADWHKTVVYVLGVTVTLIGLTSFQILNFISWTSELLFTEQITQSTTTVEDELCTPRSQEFIPGKSLNGQHDGIDAALKIPHASRISGESLPQQQIALLTGCNCEYCINFALGYRHDTKTSEYCGETNTPLCSLPRDPSTNFDTWLNCPHFTNGIYQICLLCWLSSPHTWTYGPTLGPGSKHRPCCTFCGRQCECALQPDSYAGPCYGSSAVGLTCALAETASFCRNVYHRYNVYPIEVKSNLSDPKRRTTEWCDLSTSSVIPKQPRSSGDGAPSSALTDTYEECSKTGNTFGSSNWTILQSTPRPVFYSPNSEEDLSSMSSCFREGAVIPHHAVSKAVDSEQFRISASRLISKALSLIHTSRSCKDIHCDIPSSPGTVHIASSSPILLDGMTANKRKNDVHKKSQSDSSLKDSTEQFEYDDLFSGLCYLEHNTEASDSLSPGLTEEERIVILNILETLSSVLHQKHESSLLGSQQAQSATADDTIPQNFSLTNDSPSCEPVNKSKLFESSFTGLSKKASDLAEDLASLEGILDRLHYKICVNEIELANAEDNLATAWHLHDNLDSMASSSIASSLICSVCEDCRSDTSNSGDREHMESTEDGLHISSMPNSVFFTSETAMPVSSCLSHEGAIETSSNSFCDFSSKSFQVTVPTITESTMDSTYPLSSVSVMSQPSALMTSSMPERQLTEYTSGFSNIAVRSTFSHNNRKMRSYRCRWHRPLSTHEITHMRRAEDLPCFHYSRADADGFWHPELAFEKDGVIDWETSIPSENQQPLPIPSTVCLASCSTDGHPSLR